MTVMIGVDPHKGSHTAVAFDEGERCLAELRVRSGPKQLERLVRWAASFPERAWAIENATAEYLVANAFGGELAPPSEKSWDVRVGDRRLQVKVPRPPDRRDDR